MTQPAPQTTAETQPSGGGNFFTQKWGPLPVWAWLATGAAALLIISYLRNKQNQSGTSQSTTTDASQIPQFINQTYETVSPPNVSQAVTVSGSPATNPSTPVKLGGITAETILKKGENKTSWARKIGVPARAVFQEGQHVWTYAKTGNAKEGVTAEAKLGPGETIQSWANKVGVSEKSVQRSGSNVWTYSPRANTTSQTLNVQTPSVVAGT